MDLSALTAISPVDGRYRRQVEALAPYFSEFGLIHYRVRIEIEYFIALCEWPVPQLDGVSADQFPVLRAIYEQFSEADAQRIKDIEKTTNHDVKAVEYFIKEKLKGSPVEPYLEFVHFGLTSQDINNTAIDKGGWARPLFLYSYDQTFTHALPGHADDLIGTGATGPKDYLANIAYADTG